MFAEEEWTDSPSADVSNQAAVNVVASPPAKEKNVGKRSLMRTLQTLGSVPDWKSAKAFGESDEEESSTPNKRRKKRCKKRKRSSNVDKKEDQNGQVDTCETPVKKKKPMKKIKKELSPKASQDSSKEENDKKASGGTQSSQTEQKLSRKQWKTKMKNKKRCKNKYVQQAADVDNADAKMELGGESKSSPATEKVKKDPESSKKAKKPKVKNGISLKDEEDKSKDSRINVKRVQSKTQTAGDGINSDKNLHDVFHTEKKTPMSKKSQIQAETLRKKLKLQLANDRNANKHEDKEKHNDKTVDLKDKAQQRPTDRSAALRLKMVKRLEAARFRFINELLYSSSSGEARRMFQQDPDAIGIYHRGYTAQVEHWPENPVDSIITYINQKPASLVVADFGCGDCKIARNVKNKVHSFDLAPVCKLATACDMSQVPLRDSSVDIAVFCLSLMGTNLGDFIKEANRVLVMGGVLKIAEVASRFDDERSFVGAMSRLGFKLSNKDTENSHFYSFEFIKTGNAPENMKRPGLQLKPCLYKKR